jgi:hypothetical protein
VFGSSVGEVKVSLAELCVLHAVALGTLNTPDDARACGLEWAILVHGLIDRELIAEDEESQLSLTLAGWRIIGTVG